MHKLDTTGLSCPLPVVQVTRAIEAGQLPLQVIADKGAPRENIKRLAQNKNLSVKETELGFGQWLLELTRP